MEISVAGVPDRGDIVLVDKEPNGTLPGFDACHFPHHYNVLIHTAWTLTGPEAGLRPGSQVSFQPPPSTDGDPGTSRP